MATTKTADSSVVVALSELVRMEQERIESDREREEKRLAEARAERERVDAAARAAEQAQMERAARDAQVAEAEARLRVEADRERDQRITAMRAELARVESERQAMRIDLESRLAPREPARPSGWALAFGMSSLVAASLAALLVMQGSRVDAMPPAPLAVSTRAAVTAPAVETAPLVVAPAATPTPEAAPAVAASPAPRVHRHRDHAQVDDARIGHGTDIIGLDTDDGSDDVLGPLVQDPRLHH